MLGIFPPFHRYFPSFLDVNPPWCRGHHWFNWTIFDLQGIELPQRLGASQAFDLPTEQQGLLKAGSLDANLGYADTQTPPEAEPVSVDSS